MRPRTKLQRRTRETKVEVRLTLDGTGRTSVALGDRWYEHMVETLVKFARFDLTLRAQGDLGHHIVEDAAIALGRALRQALAGRPVERMGWATVAMDDALVHVAVDLVERPFADLALPDEMLEHFLRSFALEARITVHNLVHKGRNPHHINEATMKALGLALRNAVRPSDVPMSTKGEPVWKAPPGPARSFR